MTYQVLARKWRPRSFDEVTGQDHVTTPLRNAIRTGRVPHALLLTGPRGTGKTTLARIFACCLNAEKGPTDSPDADDPACLEIASGSSTDVQEIDAASRTSVDDVRELIEAVRYAPSPGKYRVYIVDEVHMLSTAAFNALLKTLEEPPPRCLFIFCTTNPEKIPFTVVSRCQRYDLRRIQTADVAGRLREIAGAEGVEISDVSLLAVARAGEGSLRDSLTLFDQLIAFGGTQVDDAQVAQVLDLIDGAILLGIATACVDGDAAAALEGCRHAWDAGIDAKRLGGALLGTLRDLVVLRIAPDTPGLVEGSDDDVAGLRELAARAEEPRLRRMFRALVREQEDLAWAPDPFAVLEMAIVRLASLPAGDQVAELLARIAALEARLRGGPAAGPAGGGGNAPSIGTRAGGGSRATGGSRAEAGSRSASGRAPARASSDTQVAPDASASPPPYDEHEAPPLAAAPEPAPEPAPEEPTAADVPMTDPGASAPLPLIFDRLRAFAQEENRGLFASFEGGRLLERAPGKLRIALPSSIATRRLESRAGDLAAICERFFGQPMRVELETLGEAAAGTDPTRTRGGRTSPTAKRQRQEALNHPAVNEALEILGAEIQEIRPTGSEPGGTA